MTTQLLLPQTSTAQPVRAPQAPTAEPTAPDRCTTCGDAVATGPVISQHRTSEGTIVYTRCECGALQVRLQRPDTGERVLATGRRS